MDRNIASLTNIKQKLNKEFLICFADTVVNPNVTNPTNMFHTNR